MVKGPIWQEIHRLGYVTPTVSRFEYLLFFLWGHLKSWTYNSLPKTLDDLKANIERKIKKVSKNILKSNFLNFQKRCELVFCAEGGHIKIK
jgi:hypothetical protein